MNNSFFFNLINKFYLKRQKKIDKINNSQLKTIYLFLNSNPWFSAVSDYSLQVCLYLKQNNQEIYYGAEKGSTKMDKKCKENNINYFYIPIHNLNIINFILSFIKIIKILSDKKLMIKSVFAFEGREHSLLVLSKILFPFLWKKVSLVRVRGQSQVLKNNFLSRLVYKYYTDKIFFAANCVLNRVQFELPKEKYIIQYYCKNFLDSRFCQNDTMHSHLNLKNNYSFTNKFPNLNFENLTYLVLGRFDVVKGHEMVLKSFLNLETDEKIQLIFIGKSENIQVKDLFEKYSISNENKIVDNNKYYYKHYNKEIFIIDEKFNDLEIVMQNSHFGIISSLDSEVICRVGVEFLQSSVPCLYSDAGALPEVFIDFPSFKFKKGDICELQNQMLKTIEIFKNKEQFQNLKSQAENIGWSKYSLVNFKSVFEALDNQ